MSSQRYNGYALTMLTLVYTLNLVDRGLMMLLLQPIKDDLRLSDTQLGFVTGIAFGLFYAVLGLPIARWADRGNRATIASVAIGLWGLTVMSCLFVKTYAQLAAVRVAAAIGEAGCKPPTYSLVGDYFPEPRERTRAMAVYFSGGSISALLSFVLGGWLNQHYGWRATFALLGIPGLLLALLVKFTVRDLRVIESRAVSNHGSTTSFSQVLQTLWHVASLRHLSVALILVYTLGLGLGPWYAAFMIRSHHADIASLGVWLGLVFSIGGTIGVLSGGYVAGRWFAENERGQMRMSALTVAALLPFFVAFLTLPEGYQALIALTPLIMAFSFFMGPSYALMQRLVPDQMRATTLSVVMLLANLIGMGIGPQVVGMLSDALAPRLADGSLRAAMLVMSSVALWAGYHFWHVAKTVREDLSDARAREHAARLS